MAAATWMDWYVQRQNSSPVAHDLTAVKLLQHKSRMLSFISSAVPLH